LRAKRRKLVVQSSGIVIGGYGHAVLREHRARVEPGIHSHDGDASLTVASEQGALNGRCPPPARQQRGMNVPRAKRRQVEHLGRQQQPIGGDNEHLGLRSIKAVHNFGRSEMLRLKDSEPACKRQAFHRASYRLHTAPGRSIRLRQDERNVMPGLQQAR
jgi:hypothetical protein